MSDFAKPWALLAPVAIFLLAAGALQNQVSAQADSHDTLEQRTTMIAAGVQQLQEIHLMMDAEEEGKRKAIRELCIDGSLEGNICNGD